jgi:hypothetical protein
MSSLAEDAKVLGNFTLRMTVEAFDERVLITSAQRAVCRDRQIVSRIVLLAQR